jgi:hypothetical protein
LSLTSKEKPFEDDEELRAEENIRTQDGKSRRRLGIITY